MLTFIFVMVMISTYLSVLSATYKYTLGYSKTRCPGCIRSKGSHSYYERCDKDQPPSCAAVALLWPVALPAYAVYHMTPDPAGKSRAERRREQEMIEADHQTELARKALKAEQYLNEQLALQGKKELMTKPRRQAPRIGTERKRY